MLILPSGLPADAKLVAWQPNQQAPGRVILVVESTEFPLAVVGAPLPGVAIQMQMLGLATMPTEEAPAQDAAEVAEGEGGSEV